MNPEVTIAIPVFIRTKYFRFALESVLRQTVPVKILVHDASPTDAGFRDLIGKDADRVIYYHAPDNLGMAGNWTRCLKLCDTDWISILHEDDILTPNAIEILLEAKRRLPGKAIYFGLEDMMDERGVIYVSKERRVDGRMVEISPQEYALTNQFYYPGALVDRGLALSVGGFNPGLKLTPDWDLWVRLCLLSGAARINRQTAAFREYFDPMRGTTVIEGNGTFLPRVTVQRRRNLARLKVKFPGYVAPPEAALLTPRMARTLLLSKGRQLGAKGRRISFLYASRLITGRKDARGPRLWFALVVCWWWWLLSYLWPFYFALWPYYWPARNFIGRRLRRLSGQRP